MSKKKSGHAQGSGSVDANHQSRMGILEPSLQFAIDVAGLNLDRRRYRSVAEIAAELQAVADSLSAEGDPITAAVLARDTIREARALGELFADVLAMCNSKPAKAPSRAARAR